MMADGGVWVRIFPPDTGTGGGAPGAAVISAENGATVERGKVIDGKTYDIYTFTDSTRNDLSLTVDSAGLADALVIGGGGGGGGYWGGGGGCAHAIAMTVFLDVGPFPVVIGAGGAGGNQANTGSTGNPSSFAGISAIGGSGGTGSGLATALQGIQRPGAGGAGRASATYDGQGTREQNRYPAIPGYGLGGTAVDSSPNVRGGGGGGGAGGAGVNGSNPNGGAGGAGVLLSTIAPWCSEAIGNDPIILQGGEGGGRATSRDGIAPTTFGSGGGAAHATALTNVTGAAGFNGRVIVRVEV